MRPNLPKLARLIQMFNNSAVFRFAVCLLLSRVRPFRIYYLFAILWKVRIRKGQAYMCRLDFGHDISSSNAISNEGIRKLFQWEMCLSNMFNC